jgi:type III pantothenate kinase
MLLIDIGNSRCKWARVVHGIWMQQGSVNHAEMTLLEADFAGLPSPSKIVLSNVAGESLTQQVIVLCRRWSAASFIRVAAQATQCGVINTYQYPERLGSDRWAALIAAWAQIQGACLVVNCGTATTVDALSEKGEFLGGLILPGINMMRQSLSQETAQLALTVGSLQDFPRNTSDAMQSGILRATLGAIEYQYQLLNKALNIPCLLTGGAADQVRSRLKMPLVEIEPLVLKGLYIIGETKAC